MSYLQSTVDSGEEDSNHDTQSHQQVRRYEER